MGAAAEFGHVAQVRNRRPAGLEDEAGLGVGFGEGDGLETHGLKAK